MIGDSSRALLPAAVAAAALLGGCVADPPPAEEVRKQALPNVALDQPWRADPSVSAESVQDDWLRVVQ